MKLLLLFLLCAQLQAGEKVTTPKLGEFTEVEFTQVEGERVRFKHKDGGGITEISKLPKELQEKVKTLPKIDMVVKKAAEAEQKDKEIKDKYKTEFGGKLVAPIDQVIPGKGILIRGGEIKMNTEKIVSKTVVVQEYIIGSANFGRSGAYKEVAVEKLVSMGKTRDIGNNERMFIYCDTKGLHDDGMIWNVEIYPVGTFSYETVGAGTKTVLAYTTNLDAGLSTLLESIEEKK